MQLIPTRPSFLQRGAGSKTKKDIIHCSITCCGGKVVVNTFLVS